MSSLQLTFVTLAAVLLFWAVGAYNRLMGLRNAILRAYLPVDQQLKLRQALLQQQFDLLAPLLPEQAELLSALQAASTQAQAAATHARNHPGAVGALHSLRLAEDILLGARARLPAPTPLAPTPPADSADDEPIDSTAQLAAQIAVQLAAADSALQFARGRFNEAVLEYNHAVQQFPTWLLAGLFGFRVAGAF